MFACGVRSPLDYGGDGPDDSDGSIDTDASDLDVDQLDDGATDSSRDARSDARDGGVVGVDTGIPILNCGLCLTGTCQAPLVGCLTNQGCRDILSCAATKCLGGGGTPDPACLLSCANGNIGGGLLAIQAFTCVAGQCGSSCLSALGGLGGGLGGQGGDGGSPFPF